MGQIIGKPIPNESAIKFLNLPREAIESLWDSYNLLGEGWGVDLSDFNAIVSNANFLIDNIKITENDIEKLFITLDTDKNGLIDVLECIVTLCITSGMDTIDKIYFIFSLYDFEHNNLLTHNGITLLLRSIFNGFNKITTTTNNNNNMPNEIEISKYADLVFKDVNKSITEKISSEEFQHYCCLHPIISSYIRYMSSISTPIINNLINDLNKNDSDIEEILSNYTTTRKIIKKKKRIINNFSNIDNNNNNIDNNNNIAVDHPWFEFAITKMLPDEIPVNANRTDLPEDILDPIWIHGYCAINKKNNIRYGLNNNILIPVSNNLLSFNKNEEGQWIQNRLTKHYFPIVCLETSISKKLCVTADSIDNTKIMNSSITNVTSTIIIWDLKTGNVQGSIVCTNLTSIRCLDFSADEKYLLVIGNDNNGTILIYEINTLKLIYSTNIISYQNPCLNKNIILDGCFCNTNTMFCIVNGTGNGKIDFFIEEDGSYMGNGKLKAYNHYEGLFQTMGKDAVDIPVTCIQKFEFPDELIIGNASGHVMYWRGRNCLQLLSVHNNKAIVAMSYNSNSKLLITGGKDKIINLFNLLPITCLQKNRILQVIACIDITGSSKEIISYSIRSLCLSDDGSKSLLLVKSGEVLEISCKNNISSDNNNNNNNDDENNLKKLKLGDDINNGPIIKSHWNRLMTNTDEQELKLQDINKNNKNKNVMITGLCKIPGGFLSCASDGVIRKWIEGEGNIHKCDKYLNFDSGCLCIASSKLCGAVSFDGILNESRKNTIQLFNLNEFTFITTLPKQDDFITCLEFSSDGNLLGSGLNNNNIIIFNTNDGITWGIKGTLIGHNTPIVNFDFSNDGQFLRSIDAAENFIVWDLNTNFGTQINSRDILKTIIWNTHNCPVNWDLQNVWSGLKINERIISCDRYNNLFVTGLISGEISLSRVPNRQFNISPNDLQFRKIFAHYGGVSCIKFLDEGLKLVTAGLLDGCIQVWNVGYDLDEYEPDVLPVVEGEEVPVDEEIIDDGEELDENGQPKPKFIYYDSGDDEDLLDGPDVIKYISKNKKNYKDNKPIPPSCSIDNQNIRLESLSAITNWIDTSMSIPIDEILINSANTTRNLTYTLNDELQLKWVHGGYASRFTRNSLRYSKQGKIIYPAGSMGICYNKVNSTQLQFCGHDSSITALDVHIPSGIAASVQASNENVILCIWDADTTILLRRIDCGEVYGVSAITFSPDGNYIALACLDISHTILIFDWKNNILHAKYNGGSKKILCLIFNLPYSPIPSILPNENESGILITNNNKNINNISLRLLHGGLIHFSITDIKNQNIINTKIGRYGDGVKKSNILCCCALPLLSEGGNEFLVGCSNGTIGVISRNEKRISNFLPILERGSITSLWVCKIKDATLEEGPNYQIIVGATQGHIKILDMEFTPISEFNIYAHDLYNLFPIGQVKGIKSICSDKTNRKLLIGTSSGEILEIQIQNGEDINNGPIVQSHFCGELLALDSHPSRQECVTVGDDKTLCIWDLEKNIQMNKIALPDIGRCVSFAPNGFIIAVGIGAHNLNLGRIMPRENDGKVVVVSYMQNVLRIIHETIDTSAPISSVLFSPDSSLLFAASRARTITIYNALANFELSRVIDEGIVQPIRSLDITVDGVILSIQGEDDELILYDLEKRQAYPKYDNNLIFTQNKWNSRRNTIGNDNIGIYPRYGNSHDITCMARNHDNNILVTGDIWGNINLYQYPCPLPDAPYKNYKAHSLLGGVSQVIFSANDEYILSIGKYDKILLQWKLCRSNIKTIDSLPEGGLLPKRKYKRIQQNHKLPDITDVNNVNDGKIDTSNNFNLTNFTINGISFIKEDIDNNNNNDNNNVPIELIEIYGTNQIYQKKSPKAYYIGSGDIISYVGNTAYVINRQKEKQLIWKLSSNNEIGVLSVSEDGRYVFIGDRDTKMNDLDIFARTSKFIGSLYIYDSITGNQIALIDNTIYGGVNAIIGSPCGKYIACIGNDDQNSLYLYYSPNNLWQEDIIKLFCGKVSIQPQHIVSFILQQQSNFILKNTNDSYQLVTGGSAYLRFWKLHNNGTLTISELAEYNTTFTENNIDGNIINIEGYKPNVITTGAISIGPGLVVTSDILGTLYFWNGKKCINSIDKAHNDNITTLVSSNIIINGHSNFISGSSDCIKVWNNQVPIRIISLNECLNKLNIPILKSGISSITSISIDSTMKRMLIGLNSSSTALIEMAVDSESILLLSEGNVGSDIILITNPLDPLQFITASNTGLLKLWNRSNNLTKCIERHELDEIITEIKWISNGNFLVVATCKSIDNDEINRVTGNILFITINDGHLNIINKLSINNSNAITQIKFSADSSIMAVASNCGAIYIYDRQDKTKYSFVGRIYVPTVQYGLDFSSDNRFLRSFSKVDYLCNEIGENLSTSAPTDIHFFDLQASGVGEGICGRELTSKEMLEMMMNSTAWSTCSSPFITECKGLVDLANSEGSIITSINISSDLKLIVTGYNNGAVRVHKYPCYTIPNTTNTLLSSVKHTNGSNVRVSFNCDNSIVYSTGSIDGAVYVWKINS